MSKIETKGTELNADAGLVKEIKDAAQSIVGGNLELRTLQLESQQLVDEITLGGIPESVGEILDDIVTGLVNKLQIHIEKRELSKLNAWVPSDELRIAIYV